MKHHPTDGDERISPPWLLLGLLIGAFALNIVVSTALRSHTVLRWLSFGVFVLALVGFGMSRRAHRRD